MEFPDYRMRTGRKVFRTLYLSNTRFPENGDWLIGIVDTPELAAEIVRRWNKENDGQQSKE